MLLLIGSNCTLQKWVFRVRCFAIDWHARTREQFGKCQTWEHGSMCTPSFFYDLLSFLKQNCWFLIWWTTYGNTVGSSGCNFSAHTNMSAHHLKWLKLNENEWNHVYVYKCKCNHFQIFICEHVWISKQVHFWRANDNHKWLFELSLYKLK